MSVVPQFATPAVPFAAVPVAGPTLPLVSPSEWNSYPSGVSAKLLAPKSANPTAELFGILTMASRLADDEVFGAGQSAPGAHYGFAQQSVVQQAVVPIVAGEMRLRCRVLPVVSFTGGGILVAGSVLPFSASQVSATTFSGLVIHVPANSTYSLPLTNSSTEVFGAGQMASGHMPVVWSYIAGYGHSSLAASVALGAQSLTLSSPIPFAPSGTVLWVNDYAGGIPEPVTVASQTGTTLNLQAPTLYAHTIPAPPDFISVSQVPSDIREAVIYMTSAALMSGGQMSVMLATAGASTTNLSTQVEGMMDEARCRLNEYKVWMR